LQVISFGHLFAAQCMLFVRHVDTGKR